MNKIRDVRKIVKGTKATDGAGVKLVRVIGYNDTKEFDPFLMLDAFDSINPDDYTRGFPWHPHRGIETITYLISGEIEHGDSLGNKGSILDGDCQWMTAGAGIIHQEMPKASNRMLGAQLWLNLPAMYKLAPPKYRDIRKDSIPVIGEENSVVRIISGTYKGTPGAILGDYIDALYLDVEVGRDGQWSMDTDEEATVFVYIIQGQVGFKPDTDEFIPEKTAVLFNQGNTIQVKASGQGARFLLMSARPLREPIAWGGPIVMNTREELQKAFEELEDGTFIKGNVAK